MPPTARPPSTAGPAVVVRPVRLTDRLVEIRRFLEALGPSPQIEAERGGRVGVHPLG